MEEDPLPAWPRHLYTLAARLKYLEPLYTTSTGELAERNEQPLRAESPWSAGLGLEEAGSRK